MSVFDPEHDSDTRALHDKPCPGCGFEPEVVAYYREVGTKKRIGYTCTCGFQVRYGIVVMQGDRWEGDVGRDKGNAGDWTEGDAQAQEAELAGIRDPSLNARVELHRTYEANREKAEQLLAVAAKACKNQGGGKTAELKPQGKGWAIIITGPKGKKK